jgi:hypothetical protein
MWKKYPYNLASFVNFKKLPKENNSSIGENLPNLVTLVASLVRARQLVARARTYALLLPCPKRFQRL